MDRSINKILNIIIALVIFLMILSVTIGFLSPLFYSDTSKTVGGNYTYLNESYILIEKYIDSIMKKEYTKVNNCLAKIRQEEKDVYDNYSIYLIENYKKLEIKKIEKINTKNYLITCTIATSRENKFVLHSDNNFKNTTIYYDKLLTQF